MKLTYAVVIEQTPNNYSAYVPDVPGCVSTGDTWDEMLAMIREALTFHVEALIEDGDPIPEPTMSIDEAIAYHSQPIPGDVLRSYLEFGEPAPTRASTRNREPQVEGLQHPEQRLEARIPIAGQRPVQRLPANSTCLGDGSHAAGAGDVTDRLGEERGVPLLQGNVQVLDHRLVAVEEVDHVELLETHHVTSPS